LLQGNNFITATADFAELMKPLVLDLTVEKLDAGHWIMLERPAETNALMKKFLEQ
jgi:pimeloyl-ACP methyl ester carboxylesterase